MRRPRRSSRARPARALSLLLVLPLAGLLVAYDYSRTPEVVLPYGPATPQPTEPTDEPVWSGTGTMVYAAVDGPVAGQDGPLLRYRVGVEEGLGISLEEFAAAAEAVLSDPRSWTADGTRRLQRVATDVAADSPLGGTGRGPGYDFTIYLASPVLSERICREGGLHTEQFTSCRPSDGRVVINSARWLTAIEDYGAPLAEYRAYVINHEVGHQLGYQHELCPGAGQPAPVMQQQTYGLQGCVAYGWPFREGRRYAGPLV